MCLQRTSALFPKPREKWRHKSDLHVSIKHDHVAVGVCVAPVWVCEMYTVTQLGKIHSFFKPTKEKLIWRQLHHLLLAYHKLASFCQLLTWWAAFNLAPVYTSWKFMAGWKIFGTSPKCGRKTLKHCKCIIIHLESFKKCYNRDTMVILYNTIIQKCFLNCLMLNGFTELNNKSSVAIKWE